jgi:hypothetical protein
MDMESGSWEPGSKKRTVPWPVPQLAERARTEAAEGGDARERVADRQISTTASRQTGYSIMKVREGRDDEKFRTRAGRTRARRREGSGLQRFVGILERGVSGCLTWVRGAGRGGGGEVVGKGVS